jgi:hypothetical protein
MNSTRHSMTARGGAYSRRPAGLPRLAAGLVVLLALVANASAREEMLPAPVIGPLLAEEPGLIDAITRWIDQSAATVGEQLKDARESIDGAAGRARNAAQDAAAAIPRLPNTSVVTGRQRCVTAPNGGADCSGAIAALCRTKGFEGGRSLDIEATRKCPAEMLLSGRMPAPSECPSESFVIRAMCEGGR